METIIIERNRNYFRRGLIILLMIFLIYELVVFLRNPSEHTYFLFPSKIMVIIFSVVGIVTCVLMVFLVLKSIFRKDGFLKVDEIGVFNGFFLYKKKLVKWEEISRIKTINYNRNKYIAIFLKRTINTEKGISSFLFKLNDWSMGTPYIIYSGDLNCSFDELEQLISENYRKFKT